MEIKTRFSIEMIEKARQCTRDFGSYFKCIVGEGKWWRAVPRENRGQVIQQAAVLQLDHVLFVVATSTQIVMQCLVEVPLTAQNTYLNALAKWSHLMDWAHEYLHTTGPPPEPPQSIGGEDAFSEKDAYILSTHTRVWRAIRKMINSNGGPIYPIYVIKAAVQMRSGQCVIKL